MSEVRKMITELESEMSLPNGFFDELKDEQDWSFILKCHALMESACSYLLTTYFGNPDYEDIFSRLEMSDIKKGKVAFLRASGLIVPEEARFIIGLSELRNRLIHNIQGVSFNFSKHISSLDDNQKRAFVENFGYGYQEFDKNDKPFLKEPEVVLNDPKSAIFFGVALILAIIKIQVKDKCLGREVEGLEKKIYNLTKSLTGHPT